jgi:prepilin-type N-terminal cleavage/methylation domain-containing protein
MELERQQVVQLTRRDGFSLVEVMVAMLVLVVGMMSLVGVAAVGITRAGQSSPMLIAREKAREAIESVHTARDTGQLTWDKINNVGNGGIFLSGPQPLKLAGADGLVNTDDDADLEELRSPGPDGQLDTSDDVVMPLENFTREIAITPINNDDSDSVNKNLRQIAVTVKYKVNSTWQTYTITTYISSFS